MKRLIEPPNEHGVSAVYVEGYAEIACPKCGRKAIVEARELGFPGVALRGKIIAEPVERSHTFACVHCQNSGTHQECTVTVIDESDRGTMRTRGKVFPNNSCGPRLSHWLLGIARIEWDAHSGVAQDISSVRDYNETLKRRARLERNITPRLDADAWKVLVTRIEHLEAENARLKEALADAIRRPMGVIPASAEGLLSDAALHAAESRCARAALEGK